LRHHLIKGRSPLNLAEGEDAIDDRLAGMSQRRLIFYETYYNFSNLSDRNRTFRGKFCPNLAVSPGFSESFSRTN
jgi:hypothetical protein